MNDRLQLAATLASVIVATAGGLALRSFDLSDQNLQLISFPGEIFLQALKMIILPLIFSSLISALGRMESGTSAKMGGLALIYYTTTAFMAITVSITLAIVIHPGDPNSKKFHERDSSGRLGAFDSVMDLFRNLFPENVVEATLYRSRTEYQNITGGMKKVVVLSKGPNVLGLIVFCTGFGIIISTLGSKAKIVVDFFVVLDQIVMKFVSGLMWLSPLGILSLICSSIVEVDDLSVVATSMGMFVFTVFLALTVHCVILIPTISFFITRRNPITIFKSILPAFLTAFGTASSGATLPQALKGLEDHVDGRVARFIMPLGNTINMDGNALYEAIAVIFIAQMNNVPLSMVDIITISLTATFASIGFNSVPAGLVCILAILSSVGLPATEVSMLYTTDWLIDRIRTALNVAGDAYAANFVDHCLKNELKEKYNSVSLPEDAENGTQKKNDDFYHAEDSFGDIQHERGEKSSTTGVYSLKNAILTPLRAHVSLQMRLSQLPEEPAENE